MTIKLKAPTGCASFAINGHTFAVDCNGFLEIPREHLSDALDHQFKFIETIDEKVKNIVPEKKLQKPIKKAD